MCDLDDLYLAWKKDGYGHKRYGSLLWTVTDATHHNEQHPDKLIAMLWSESHKYYYVWNEELGHFDPIARIAWVS